MEMNNMKTLLLLLLLLPTLTAAGRREKGIRWDFDSLDGWVYEHQDTSSHSMCYVKDGMLRIDTRPFTYDRQKMHTREKTYRAGRYRWRTFISNIADWEQVSIGSWIYHDDHHELDFEVGYGTSNARRECGAKDGELVVYMTNQDHPRFTKCIPIKPGWHDFEIRLDRGDAGNYRALWLIDGKVKQDRQLQFGEEIPFYIYCSVENLRFLGEKIAEHSNYGLFDWVEYKANKRKNTAK